MPDSLNHRREMALVRLRYIVAAVKPFDISPTRLAQEAGLGHNFINRKLTGGEDSITKPQSLAQIEEAASRLMGKPLTSSEALMDELDATNHQMARLMTNLVRVFLQKGLIEEHELPADLLALVHRRRTLLELLGMPLDEAAAGKPRAPARSAQPQRTP